MFTINPFAELSASLSPAIMQTYVTVMILLVIAGTVFDVIHKGSAKYFFANWRSSQAKGEREVSGGELVSIAVQTAVVDVLASGEFCSQKRRIAHLLGMYGFIAFALATAVMVYRYPTVPSPGVWPFLWWLGALMICVGGYWFWFFIRADVSAEGNSPFRIVQADLFILSLLGSATFGLIWAFLQLGDGGGVTTLFFWLYVVATTMLFGSVPWSKFAHMFFKPAAAFEKRVSAANGSRANLPGPADKPATFGNPREHASHY